MIAPQQKSEPPVRTFHLHVSSALGRDGGANIILYTMFTPIRQNKVIGILPASFPGLPITVGRRPLDKQGVILEQNKQRTPVSTIDVRLSLLTVTA